MIATPSSRISRGVTIVPAVTMRKRGRVALPWETVVCSGRPLIGPPALSTPSVVA